MSVPLLEERRIILPRPAPRETGGGAGAPL